MENIEHLSFGEKKLQKKEYWKIIKSSPVGYIKPNKITNDKISRQWAVPCQNASVPVNEAESWIIG